MDVSYGPFQFSSNFECGNLAKVLPIEAHGPSHGEVASTHASNSGLKSSRLSHISSSFDVPVNYEFSLWTQPDCAGTEFENNNRTWFCFSIKGGEPGQRVSLTVMNLNRQFKLFSQGMQPVMQSTRDTIHLSRWERIKEKCSYRSEESSTIISWVHIVPSDEATTYYAFTYPYTYSDLQSYLVGLDQSYMHGHSNLYYHRELLIYSQDGWRVDLITVSSESGMSQEREDRLPSLFPDPSTPRPFKFSDKKVVFISARVHPGETSSSFVLNGFLNFILSKDPRANKLRELFVFKLVPMLNPDGVVRGHYRTDQRGVNLNRVYVDPSLKFHPTIYAARQIILYHHFEMQIYTLLEAEEKNHPETLIKDSSSVSHPSLLDEDTCHSFGDAAKKTSDSLGTGRTPPLKGRSSLMDTDEPSASGWDVSSNFSVDSSSHIGLGHDAIDAADIHDDCSNFSCASEGETGVTSMFCSFSPLRDFKSVSTELQLPKKGAGSLDAAVPQSDHTRVEGCTCASNIRNVESDVSQSSSCLKCADERKHLKKEKETSFKSNILLSSPSTSQTLGLPDHPLPIQGKAMNTLNEVVKASPAKDKKPSSLFSSSESEAEVTNKKDLTRSTTVSSLDNIHKRMTKGVFPLSANKSLLNMQNSLSKSGLFLYVDLHGHASKRGIFMYGNWFQDPLLMVENLLFPKLMTLNCPNFDFDACNFSERNMYHKDKRGGMSKEGSGRVAVMQSTGLLRSYTLECNYNTGRTYNPIPPSPLSHRKPPVFPVIPPKYTPAIYEDCGRQLGVSILDTIESNDWSRLPHSPYNSLTGLRNHLISFLESSSLSPKSHIGVYGGASSNIHSSRMSKSIANDHSSIAHSDTSSPSNAVSLSRRLGAPKQVPPSSPSSPRFSKVRSRIRKSSWSLSVDAENQEPSTYLQSGSKIRSTGARKNSSTSDVPPRSKTKSPRLKPPIPRNQKVSRSLTYTEISDNARYTSDLCSSKLCSSKHSLSTSVSLTPNLNVKLSISEDLDPNKQMKKIEGLKKQRRKGMNIGNKKLKTTAPRTSASEKGFYGLTNLSPSDVKGGSITCSDSCTTSQGPLSPRSPLASVCEPQASQSTSQAASGIINVLAIPPKSPSLVTSSKKTFHSPIKRPKHSLKSLSKSVDRLPAVTGGSTQRIKLLPKKAKKKGACSVSEMSGGAVTPSTASQSSFDWIISEPVKFTAQIETTKAKTKRRKKNRKSL